MMNEKRGDAFQFIIPHSSFIIYRQSPLPRALPHLLQ